MKKIPAYQNVYNQIRAEIVSGHYAPGSFLPTEKDLEEIYSVSRTTIRTAVNKLAGEGLLKVQQGRGTTVLEPSVARAPVLHSGAKSLSLTNSLKRQGYAVSTKAIGLEKIQANAELAKTMNLPEGTPVYKLQRIQYADNVPISYTLSHITVSAAPGLEEFMPFQNGLYDVLEREYHFAFEEIDETFTAVGADFVESQLLQIPAGTPLFCGKRLVSSNGQTTEYTISKSVGNKFEYHLHRSNP